MVEHLRSAELDRVFSTLADPTRRAILRRLSTRPATINEIAEPFQVSLNAISKHVMMLEPAGMLRREIKGSQHYCWIEPGPLREANEWFGALPAILGTTSGFIGSLRRTELRSLREEDQAWKRPVKADIGFRCAGEYRRRGTSCTTLGLIRKD